METPGVSRVLEVLTENGRHTRITLSTFSSILHCLPEGRTVGREVRGREGGKDEGGGGGRVRKTERGREGEREGKEGYYYGTFVEYG